MSPVLIGLIAIALINLAWLVVFLFNVYAGDLQYAYPRGLRALLAQYFTVRGVDLSLPAVIAYNLSLTAGPLALLAHPDLRSWNADVGRRVGELLARHGARLPWVLAAALVLLVVVIVLGDHTRLPFTQERVRWATDSFPLAVPYENPLFVRFQYVLASVLDARYSFVLGNMIFHVICWGFLVSLLGGRRAILPVTAAYVAVASHYWLLWYLNGAEAELPAAVFGFMGFMLMARGRPVPATFALTMGMLLKPSAVYYALAAAVLLLWRWARGTARPSAFPWSLAIASVAVLVPYYVGFTYYVLILRGGTYILDRPENPFFVATFSAFLTDFVRVYPAHMLVAAVGLIWSRVPRGEILFLFAAVLLLRSTYTVGGGYYEMMFVPIWALLTAGLLMRARDLRPSRRWLATALPLGVLLVADVVSYATSREFITRSTSHWDELVARMRVELPAGATVFHRKISPKYDLVRQGRTDLDFEYLSEDPAAERDQVARPSVGSIVIAPIFDFDDEGRELARYGYREFSAPFGGTAGYIVYFR